VDASKEAMRVARDLEEAQSEITSHKIELKAQSDRDLQRAKDKMLEEVDAKELILNEQLACENVRLNDVVNEMKKKYEPEPSKQ